MVSRERVERAVAGDLEAYSLLAAECREVLYRHALDRLRDPDDARDAVQDAILRGLTAVGGLREPDAFVAWMRRLVDRACAALERQSARVRREIAAPKAGAAEDSAERLWLESLLSGLPAEQAEVLRGYYLEGRSTSDLSARLARPRGTIKRWLHDARARALRRGIRMSGTLSVYGPDLSSEELTLLEQAASENGLDCRRHGEDVWPAVAEMAEDVPAAVVIAKRADGPCDAFMLVAALKCGARRPQLAPVPVVFLSSGENEVIYAAWSAGVEAYLTRPPSGSDLATIVGRVIAAVEG